MSKPFIMQKKIYLAIFIIMPYCLIAQPATKPNVLQEPHIRAAAKKTPILTAEKINIPTPLSITDTTLFPVISSVNPEPKIELYYLKEFENFKDTATLNYKEALTEFEPKVPMPFQIKFGFDANNGDRSAPLDNSIGYSGNGFLISISNSYIEYYQNSVLKYRNTLSSFINHEIPNPCDPKAYFDPTSNKFILFLQRCDHAYNKSEILIAFSKTDNPFDGWNFYKLSGNPLNRPNHWFDYPKIGITQDGLFISGNIFIGSNQFSQTVVYQIDKERGYAGIQLSYRVWYDIAEAPFTVMPVNYAYNNVYGKGIYLLSTTWQNNATHIKLYDIEGDIYDDLADMNYYKVPTTPYRFFAKAVQLNLSLDNGDIRIQDAILSGGKIYYVFTSGNDRNFSRVNFNVLDVPHLVNKSILIGDKLNMSYAYPSLHILSEEHETSTVLIQYNSTSNESYPDIRCKTCDENLNCSQELVIKAGESTINNYDRWGDYSTVAKDQSRKYQLWLSSCYGKNRTRQTYIANLVSFNEPLVAIDTIIAKQRFSSTEINFNLKTASEIQVMLKSDSGTTNIFEGKAPKGENLFEIFTHELKKGNYTIEVINKNSKQKINSVAIKTQ